MNFTKNQIIAFLFGLGATITIRIVGIFAISDLIAIIFLPFLVVKRYMFVDKRFRIAIVLLLLWMFSTIISDIYNKTAIIDAVKGILTLVPFLACFVFAYWMLHKNYEIMIPFLWGYAISFTLSAGFGLDASYQESLTREGLTSVTQLSHYSKILIWISSSFINGAFSITYFKKYPRFVVLGMFLFSFLSLLEGTRSGFLFNFIISIILGFIVFETRGMPWKGQLWQVHLKKKLPGIIILLIALIFLSKNLYQISVEKGYLGEYETKKYEMQNNSKIGLLSGRGEFIGAFLAIRDSPLLGHGSYAKDTEGYGYRASILSESPPDIIITNQKEIGKYYIPTHSHIWQAWVYNGILGGVFWIYILVGILGLFIKNYMFCYPKYQAYVLTASIGTLWPILFSPFQQKTLLATTIVFIIVLMKNYKVRRKRKIRHSSFIHWNPIGYR